MRKNLFLAAAGAMTLLFASCASDEPVANVNNTPENLITYSTRISNQTRAANSYCANIMPESFNVWAHVNDEKNTLYISGDEIKKTGDGYKAVVDRYWPEEGESLSFFACVDAENTFKYNNGAPMFENYTINEDVAQQFDLMYAVTKEVTNKQTVSLNFRHALAQVCYKAVNENPNLKITVNKITVAGLANQGTFTFPTKSTTTNYENHAGTESTEDLNRGSWELNADRSASYEVNVGGIKLSDEVSNLTFPELDEDNTHVASDFSKVLALLPYDGTHTNAANITSNMIALPTEGTYFILNLTVENIAYDEDGETEVTYPLLDKKDFYVGAEFDWAQGNRYTYTFKFDENWTPDNLTPIAYEVETDDYINQDGGEIDNPTWIDTAGPAPVALGDKGYEGVLLREADEVNGVKPLYLATKNIGAENVEDHGRFFYFGDTVGKDINNTEEFGVGKYVFDNTNKDIPNRQWTGSDSYVSNGWVNQVEVEPLPGQGTTYRYFVKAEHDAATINMGSCWQLPSQEDVDWLNDNCKITEVEVNGVECIKIVSNTNSGTVYLPKAGYISTLTNMGNGHDEYGNDAMVFYWLNEVGYHGKGYNLVCNSSNKLSYMEWDQYYGMPIRGVSYGPTE